jgi:rhamnose transport system permease protein
VATLGTLSIFRGAIYVVSDGKWINSNEMSVAMQTFSSPNTRFLGLSMLEWVAVIAVLFFFLLVHHAKFGREIRALGINPSASQYMGIPEKKRQFALYTLSGAVAGVVGVLWVGRYALANTEVALGFELQVIAACVLGGVSIAGGVGTVFGAVVGGLFLVTLYNALPVIGISPFWQMGLVGVAILLAAVFNQSAAKAVGKKILRKEREMAG